MAWQDDLLPASWRGLPFYVETSLATFGRNTAVHPYPFREHKQVWVEDLGAAPSVIRITGFLLGDDVRQQHLDFFNAMQAAGRGELVHPVYGSQLGSIVGGCRYLVRKDRGRYVEVEFEFIANKDDAPYPDAEPDTNGDVVIAAAVARAAAADEYARNSAVDAPPPAQPGLAG